MRHELPVGLRSRISRRKVLGVAATTGVAVGAAALVGCGGGSSSGNASTSSNTNSLITKPKDSTAQAKPGGTYLAYTTSDVLGFDYIGASGNRDRTEGNFAYSRLFKWKPGIGEQAKGEVTGDLVDTWELAPDYSQITMKLKQNVKWDQRPPTNSRVFDSSDVKYSFDRFHAVSLYKADWFKDLNQTGTAPIDSITYPDAQTATIKLAFPLAALFDYLGNTLGLYVMPKESESQFDPKKDMRGTGAWMLDKYQPSVGMEYKRNPNFYVKDRPFLDGWSQPIVPEYATQMAQFRAGGIWGGVVKQEDIIQTKKDLPQLLLLQSEYGPTAPGIFFGWESPFRDERLRQAMSQLIDRETFAKTFSSKDQFEAQGVDLSLVYDNFLGKGWGEYWLDPYGKDAGPDAAANFKFDIANAKKLLSAAGFASGLTTDFVGPSNNAYGTDYSRWAQALGGMFSEAGIKLNFREAAYPSDYVNNYNYNQAFNGISIFVNTTYGGVANNLRTNWHSGSVQDRSPYAPAKINQPAAPKDTQLDSLIEKLLKEPDHVKSVQAAWDVQKYLSKVLYTIPFAYKIRGLSLTWPWVGNAGVYQGYAVTSSPTDTWPYLWYDASKKTS
jgi:peptide/nickel transport system substrate-binding protein